MRAEFGLGSTALVSSALSLTAAQQRVVEARDPVVNVVGPPASGKTTALAARAVACRRAGLEPVIVCSHASGSRAFAQALELVRVAADDPRPYRLATLPEHAARWLSSAYVSAGAIREVAVGGAGAARAILTVAARELLDMSWPMFARADINLDLPHLSRPEAFLDEAASLFSLLQRTRVSPEEFEEGCAAGIAAFYGERTERAEVLLQDQAVRKRASGRGREACRASAEALAAQRRAERDTAAILTQLYKDYQRAAASAGLRSAEDLIDAAIRWLSSDERSASALAAGIGALIVDDAEDAEPGLVTLIGVLRRHRAFAVSMAGNKVSSIDGLAGRRSALTGLADAARIELPLLAPPSSRAVQRFANEVEEADWLAAQIQDLLRHGAVPENIALLCRTASTAALYARHMRERGVPSSLPSSMLERDDELADLLAVCAVIDDPTDQEHLLRVLSSPLVGLSDSSLWTLCRDPAERMQLSLEMGAAPAGPVTSPKSGMLARNMARGDADSALPDSTRALLAKLRSNIASWRAHCLNLSPVERFIYLADVAGFRDRWHAAEPPVRERLRMDLWRVASAVAQTADSCGAVDFGTIARLVEDDVVLLAPASRVAGAVVCDSIVAAKGERFDHVFVAGVAHERFPRIYTSHAMAFSRTYGLIVRENIADGAAQTAKFAWYYAKFGAKAMYLDEERRALAYGLSRARTSATATGFGTPPYWAREQDLLASLDAGSRDEASSG